MKKLFAGLSMAIVIVLCLSACGPSTKQVAKQAAKAAWTAGTLHEQMTIAEKMGIKHKMTPECQKFYEDYPDFEAWWHGEFEK